MARKAAAITGDSLKTSLLEQLKKNGTEGKYYIDLAGDYIALYEVKKELQEDVKERGSKVSKLDSRGQKQLVNNESIDQLLKVNAQMLKILDALGIKSVEAESTGEKEEDAL